MAIYVTSDLHGLPLSKLRQLLQKVHFCDGDWLYILGDVIDRENDGGVEILQWLLVQPNVQLLLGNHEAAVKRADGSFDDLYTKRRGCHPDGTSGIGKKIPGNAGRHFRLPAGCTALRYRRSGRQGVPAGARGT